MESEPLKNGPDFCFALDQDQHTCFAKPERLSQEQLGSLGLQDSDFVNELYQDVNGDGLTDRFVFYFDHEASRPEQPFYQLLFLDGCEYYRAKYDDERPNAFPVQKYQCVDDHCITSASFALADVNGDSQLDIVTRLLLSSGEIIHEAVLNFNPVLYGRPTEPAVLCFKSYDPITEDRLVQKSDPYDYRTQIPVEGTLYSVYLHPQGARFVQVDSQGMFQVSGEDLIAVGGRLGAPLTFDGKLTIHFYDKNKNEIKSIVFIQKKPRVPTYTYQDTTYVLLDNLENVCAGPDEYNQTACGDSQAHDDLHLPELALRYSSSLDEARRAVSAIWGHDKAKEASQLVVMSRGQYAQSLSGSLFMPSRFELGYSESELYRTSDQPEIISIHEMAHNIENTIIKNLDRWDGVLEKTWLDLIEYDSPIFGFIDERNYFNTGLCTGRHNAENPSELFANTTVVLASGPQALQDALLRWKQDGNADSLEDLKNDLECLFFAYESVLKENYPESGFDFTPYYDVLSSQEFS